MPPRPTTPSSSYRPPSSLGSVMSRTYITVLRRFGSVRAAQPSGRSAPLRKLCRQMFLAQFGSGNTAVARRSMLLPQIGLDNLHRNGGGGISAESAAFHDDANRDLRAADRREAGEDGVASRVVVDSGLGSTGLAGDLEAASHARARDRIGGAVVIVRHGRHQRGQVVGDLA